MVSSPSPTPQSSTLSTGPDIPLPTRSLHRVLSAGRLGNRADGETDIERDDAKGYRFSPRENLCVNPLSVFPFFIFPRIEILHHRSGFEAASGASPSINDDNTPTMHTSPSDSRLHSFVLGSDRTKDRERLSSSTPRTIYSPGCVFQILCIISFVPFAALTRFNVGDDTLLFLPIACDTVFFHRRAVTVTVR